MKILQPTKFNGYMEHGGSTKPWKVFLLDEENEVPYVVKLFTDRNIEQQHAVAKEIYGNVLAKNFSLPVPEMALVQFDKTFVNELLEEPQREILKTKNKGYKFASLLAENMAIVAPEINTKFLKEYDIANVYAFDCLLYNIDRGGARNKPNLLVDNDDFLLIDHEQCFPFADKEDTTFYNNILNDLQNGILNYPYQKHLFFPMLKKMQKTEKLTVFDEFTEYLRLFSTENIEIEINQLKNLNVSTGQTEVIIDYLCRLKTNFNQFRITLLNSIS